MWNAEQVVEALIGTYSFLHLALTFFLHLSVSPVAFRSRTNSPIPNSSAGLQGIVGESACFLSVKTR